MSQIPKPDQTNKSHNHDKNISGKRSVGNLHATFEEAGAGNEIKVTANARIIEMAWKIQQTLKIARQFPTLLKHAEETNQEDLNKVIGSDLIIKKAYEELDHFYWNEKELQDYEAATKKTMDYEAAMDQKYDEGIEKGIEKGVEKEKIEVAKNMLNENMDVALIVKLTGLTIEKVTELKLET